ncbi:hypothetical protein ACA910_002476 [Epithemia clementina (nom. ined.)]
MKPSKRRLPHHSIQLGKRLATKISLTLSDRRADTNNSQRRCSDANKDDDKQTRNFRIYCDLDGVLTDFDAGVQNLTGKRVDQLSSAQLWSSIARCPNFYENLPWMPDGEELWEAIRPCRPSILTGCSAGAQVPFAKFEWCRRELCVEVNHLNFAAPKKQHVLVPLPTTQESSGSDDDEATREKEANVYSVITCWSKNKHFESGPGRVLIDDRKQLREEWEAKGGIFIWHQSTATTLEQLKSRGIILA